MNKIFFLTAVIFTALLSGCHSVPIFQSARTLEPGNKTFTLRLDCTVENYLTDPYYDSGYGLSTFSRDSIDKQHYALGLGFRIGIVNGFEFGAALDLPNCNIGPDLKFRLYENDAMALALDAYALVNTHTFSGGALLLYTYDIKDICDFTIIGGASRLLGYDGYTLENTALMADTPKVYAPTEASFMEIGAQIGIHLSKLNEYLDSLRFGVIYKKEITDHKIEIFLPYVSLTFLE